MFSGREKMHFEEQEDGKPLNSYNDIDAFLYLQLKNARTLAFDIIDHEDFSTDEVCVILLEYARQIQKHMDDERDDLIANVVKKFKDTDYCRSVVEKCRRKLKKSDVKTMSNFFDEFKGMEVINPDWLLYVSRERKFENEILNLNEKSNLKEKSNLDLKSHLNVKSNLNMKLNSDVEWKYAKGEHEFRFRQLLDYYIFRYFLDSVYDISLMLKVKNAVVGYLIVRQLCLVCCHEKGSVTFDEFVDIAHLYSRQFEHSYVNFEVYSEYFMTKRCYSVNTLEMLLLL
jgi:lysine-N-methylase